LAYSVLTVITGNIITILVVIEEFAAASLLEHPKKGYERVKVRVRHKGGSNTVAVYLAECINTVQTCSRKVSVGFRPRNEPVPAPGGQVARKPLEE